MFTPVITHPYYKLIIPSVVHVENEMEMRRGKEGRGRRGRGGELGGEGIKSISHLAKSDQFLAICVEGKECVVITMHPLTCKNAQHLYTYGGA